MRSRILGRCEGFENGMVRWRSLDCRGGTSDVSGQRALAVFLDSFALRQSVPFLHTVVCCALLSVYGFLG